MEDGVSLIYSNPGETSVNPLSLYSPSQISQSVGEPFTVSSPKVKKGYRSVLGTVIFKKKYGWNPKSVSPQVRKFRSKGYPGKLLETKDSYRYRLDMRPLIAKKAKIWRHKIINIAKGPHKGKRITMLFAIIPSRLTLKPQKAAIGARVEPITKIKMRTPAMKKATMTKGLKEKIRTKKIKRLSKKTAKKYGLEGMAKRYGVTVGAQPKSKDPVVNPTQEKKLNKVIAKEMKKNQVAARAKSKKKASARKTKPSSQVQALTAKERKEMTRKGLIAKMKSGQIKHLSGATIKKYKLQSQAARHHVGEEVTIKRPLKASREIKSFIKSEAKKGTKPSVVKALVKRKYKVELSQSTIYKISKGLYQTGAVGKQTKDGGVSQMKGRLEQQVIAEIMANPGMAKALELPSVSKYLKQLSREAKMTGHEAAKRLNHLFAIAKVNADITTGRVRTWVKSHLPAGERWRLSKFSTKAAYDKNSKRLAALRSKIPTKKGKGSRPEITDYWKNIPGVPAGASAAELKALSKRITKLKTSVAGMAGVGNIPAGYPDMNPTTLDLTGTGKDMLAKLAGIMLGTNVTGLVKRGADFVFKVDPEIKTGWAAGASNVGSGVAGYFIAEMLSRLIRPSGEFAPVVQEMFESMKTGSMLYVGQAVPQVGQFKAVQVSSGVEEYIDSIAQKVGKQVANQSPNQVSAGIITPGETFVPISEDVGGQTGEIFVPVDAQLETSKDLKAPFNALGGVDAQLEEARDVVPYSPL
jgi:hypothetical protein